MLDIEAVWKKRYDATVPLTENLRKLGIWSIGKLMALVEVVVQVDES